MQVRARTITSARATRRALAASFVNEGYMALWEGDAQAAKLLATDAAALGARHGSRIVYRDVAR